MNECSLPKRIACLLRSQPLSAPGGSVGFKMGKHFLQLCFPESPFSVMSALPVGLSGQVAVPGLTADVEGLLC